MYAKITNIQNFKQKVIHMVLNLYLPKKPHQYMSYLEQLKNKVESETTAETSVADNVQNENVSSDDVQTIEEVTQEVTQDSPSETLSETQTEQTIEQDTVVSTQEKHGATLMKWV